MREYQPPTVVVEYDGSREAREAVTIAAARAGPDGTVVVHARPSAARWLPVRLAVVVRRRHLDAQLAAGSNPLSNRMLALRARQLRQPTARRRLATTIEGAVKAARHPGVWTAAVTPRGLGRAAESDLLRIAERLRCGEAIGERGAAIASELVADGAGPLYHPAERHRLAARISFALRWLE
jgi:hypothetical protein